MSLGPGKYDDLCTYVREEAQARATIIIVIGGTKGSGFSAQGDMPTQLALPEMLEYMARQLRVDLGIEK